MATYEANAIRMLIDSVLMAHDGSCLDNQEERQTLATAINEVLTEYLCQSESK
jgi:hypothetical protein